MDTVARLAAGAVTLGLLASLTACGENNPFGQVVGDKAPTATSASPTPTPSDSALPVGTESPTDSGTESSTSSLSPSEGASEATTSPTTSGSMSPTTPAPTSPVSPTGGTNTVTQTATSGPAQGSVVQVDGRTVQGMPSGLAFPESTRIDATSAFAGGGGSVVLAAPAEKQVFAYYRSALAGAGYRVVSDTAGVIAFTGHGFRGTIVGTGTGAVLTWAPTR